MPQAIRAILLASATAATLVGRRIHQPSEPRPVLRPVFLRVADGEYRRACPCRRSYAA